MLAAAVMLVPASPILATDAATAEVDAAVGESVATEASLAQLRTLVDELTVANDALSADNDTLQAAIADLARERDELRKSLERFDDLYLPLEADRKLLVELRKSVPDTRVEAERHIADLERYALSADPARLGQLVDRVRDSAPAFLDWRFGDFGSAEEFSSAYVQTGANAFDSTMEEFRSEALFSVARRLDGLLTILDRAR
jgi:hypothetical protein